MTPATVQKIIDSLQYEVEQVLRSHPEGGKPTEIMQAAEKHLNDHGWVVGGMDYYHPERKLNIRLMQPLDKIEFTINIDELSTTSK